MKYYREISPLRLSVEWEMGIRNGSPFSSVLEISKILERMSSTDVEELKEKCVFRFIEKDETKVFSYGGTIFVCSSYIVDNKVEIVLALKNRGFCSTLSR